jgi:hypothetical protein
MTALKSHAHMLLLCTAICLATALAPPAGRALEIEPFTTFNQSPIVQIYGLPAAGSPTLVPAGRLTTQLSVDVANNFAIDTKGGESITFDGEEWRTTLAFRYGIVKGWEVGLDIPVLTEWGGILDAPIQWWHKAFGIDQSGRDLVPQGRTLFSYSRNGRERIHLTGANSGLGDLRLTSGVQLYRDGDDPRRAIALRSSLKLPTGGSSALHGSGGVDFALWLTGREAVPWLHHWALLWSAGGMIVGRGDILPEMQRDLAAFGSLGIGWQPGERYNLKLLLNGNTPFYHNSSLRELSVASVQMVAGGTVALGRNTELDLSFSEDLLVLTASPDFGITLALRTLW